MHGTLKLFEARNRPLQSSTSAGRVAESQMGDYSDHIIYSDEEGYSGLSHYESEEEREREYEENGRLKCDACMKFLDRAEFDGDHNTEQMQACDTCAQTYMLECDECCKPVPLAKLEAFELRMLCGACSEAEEKSLREWREEEERKREKRDADSRNARKGPAAVEPAAANSAASEPAERRATKRARDDDKELLSKSWSDLTSREEQRRWCAAISAQYERAVRAGVYGYH